MRREGAIVTGEAEGLRRQVARLQAELDVLRASKPSWWRRVVTWFCDLAGYQQRRRFARLIAESDRATIVVSHTEDDE